MEYYSNIYQEEGQEQDLVQIMEFSIAGEAFGIRAAKVQEIMISHKVDGIPHTHSCVEGVFKPRDTVITVVDLPKYLKKAPSQDREHELFIISSGDEGSVAFRVHKVLGMGMVGEQSIQKPDKLVYGNVGIVDGIVEFKGHLVTLLDFDKIIKEVAPASEDALGEYLQNREEDEREILLAHDSKYLTKAISKKLSAARFVNVSVFDDGSELYDYLVSLKESERPFRVGCVITGIDMPRLDGTSLVKTLKEDPYFADLPVIAVNNSFTDEQLDACEALGVKAALNRQELDDLVATIDEAALVS